MGPVSGYAGRAAHAAGYLEEAEELLREAVSACVSLGLRPNEALARSALAAVLCELDRPGDRAEAEAEDAAARSIADAIGMVLPDRTVGGHRT
jgi:Flp pilus assembly protein TadD